MKDNSLNIILYEKDLTNREIEVSHLVTKGLSNKEIANQLFITASTVKLHLTNIYKKLEKFLRYYPCFF